MRKGDASLSCSRVSLDEDLPQLKELLAPGSSPSGIVHPPRLITGGDNINSNTGRWEITGGLTPMDKQEGRDHGALIRPIGAQGAG